MRNSSIVLAWVATMLSVCISCSCNDGYQLHQVTNPDSLKLVFSNIAEAKCYFFDVEIAFNGHELSFSKVNMGESSKHEREPIHVDDSIARPVLHLIEALFSKIDVPVYEYWGNSKSQQYHEGDILDVYAYKRKHCYHSRLLIQGEYARKAQISEDYHKYRYSPQFKLLIQYLNYLSAIIANMDEEQRERYIYEMYHLSHSSEFEVLYPSEEWIANNHH